MTSFLAVTATLRVLAVPLVCRHLCSDLGKTSFKLGIIFSQIYIKFAHNNHFPYSFTFQLRSGRWDHCRRLAVVAFFRSRPIFLIVAVSLSTDLLSLAERITSIYGLPPVQATIDPTASTNSYIAACSIPWAFCPPGLTPTRLDDQILDSAAGEVGKKQWGLLDRSVELVNLSCLTLEFNATLNMNNYYHKSLPTFIQENRTDGYTKNPIFFYVFCLRWEVIKKWIQAARPLHC